MRRGSKFRGGALDITHSSARLFIISIEKPGINWRETRGVGDGAMYFPTGFLLRQSSGRHYLRLERGKDPLIMKSTML